MAPKVPLTDSAIRALKPRTTAYKLADERGLYLQVTPSGGRLWRYKFRAEGGVEKKLSLGASPDVGLRQARAARDAARSLLAKGIDPARQKRRDKHAARISAPTTSASVARSQIEKNRRAGLGSSPDRHDERVGDELCRHVGLHRPVDDASENRSTALATLRQPSAVQI